jgi:hypothetical protein
MIIPKPATVPAASSPTEDTEEDRANAPRFGGFTRCPHPCDECRCSTHHFGEDGLAFVEDDGTRGVRFWCKHCDAWVELTGERAERQATPPVLDFTPLEVAVNQLAAERLIEESADAPSIAKAFDLLSRRMSGLRHFARVPTMGRILEAWVAFDRAWQLHQGAILAAVDGSSNDDLGGCHELLTAIGIAPGALFERVKELIEKFEDLKKALSALGETAL